MRITFQALAAVIATTIALPTFVSASPFPSFPFHPLPKAPPTPFHSAAGEIKWVNCSTNVPAAISEPAGMNGTVYPTSAPPLPKELQCGKLDVPMDYSAPISPTNNITIAFTRLLANTSSSKGSIWFNPGGPGSEAQSYGWGAAITNQSAFEPLKDFDLIFLDPRGTGSSNPLNCDPKLEPSPQEILAPNQTVFDQVNAKTQAFTQSCEDMSKPSGIVGFLGSADSANDWESLRIALGYEKISWLGTSYGTYFGAEYAYQFLDRTDRIVFDAIVARGLPDVEAARFDVKALTRLMERSDAWCSRNETCPFYREGKGGIINAFKTASNLSSSEQKANLRLSFRDLVIGNPQFATWAGFLGEYLKQAQAGFPNGENGTFPTPKPSPSAQKDIFSLLPTACKDTRVDDPTFKGFEYIKKVVAKDDPYGLVATSSTWTLRISCASYSLQTRAKARTPIKKSFMLVTSDYDLNTATEQATFSRADYSKATFVIRHGDDHSTMFVPNQPAQQLEVEYLRSGKLPSPSNKQRLVTVLSPGKERPAVADPFTAPIGIEAGDMDPATSPLLEST